MQRNSGFNDFSAVAILNTLNASPSVNFLGRRGESLPPKK